MAFPLLYAFNILMLFRFSGVFPSVNAAIKRRDQALQVWKLLLRRNDLTCWFWHIMTHNEKAIHRCRFLFYVVYLRVFKASHVTKYTCKHVNILGGTSTWKGRGCSSYLSEVKKPGLVPLRVLCLKRSTVGAFVIPFRVLSWRNVTGDEVLCKNW